MEPVATPDKTPQKSRFGAAFNVAVAILAFALLWAVYWYIWVRPYATTDDAYIRGNRIVISSQILAPVKKILGDDTQLVEEDQVLVLLDDTNFKLAYESSLNELALAVRQVKNLVEQARSAESESRASSILLEKARQDVVNRSGVIGAGGISAEDYQHSQDALRSQEAQFASAQFRWKALLAQVGKQPLSEHPTILAAQDKARRAYIDLNRCTLRSPAKGFIAKRGVEVGAWVKPGDILMNVIPLRDLWVEANFKENQLSPIRVGQKVEFTTDIYGGGETFHGKVMGIVGGTGSVFSLLPPQNATGNWIKIVQRVPVRIEIDQKELEKFPLLLGLSADVSINILEGDGPFLRDNLKPVMIQSTKVYDIDMSSLEKTLEEIVSQNLGKG